MKKIVLYFFAVVLCTTGALAAGDVSISRVVPTKNENVVDVKDNKTMPARVVRRNNSKNTNQETSRNTISRTVFRDKTSGNVEQKTGAGVISRSVKNPNSGDSKAKLDQAVNTVGRNARVSAASINNTAAVRRAGVVLRASTAEVGGRATIGGTDVQTGSNIDEQVKTVHNRASIFGSSSKKKAVTAESIANAKDILEKTADLNNTCQQQYNECMDQFCAVVDANQKRCSCSANLARYAKVQEAVENANAELNDVAQRIRYVGLSADEIRAIMSATEAEQEMAKKKDSTQTRSMLDDIAKMIEDPSSSSVYSSGFETNSLLDMDLDFSADSSDMFGLDAFLNNSNDISSKRGKELYKEATKRCKSVLNQCKDAGGTESQISGNYDLAIDKDCVAYEQGLEKLNQTLISNVRSANLLLQKARLAVLQNKNIYEPKECIAALETCMLDDMVCGENYFKCIDPTKRYIDENGEVVLGKNITNIIAFMENYNNSNITADFIKDAQNDTTCVYGDGKCIVNYLMKKIGTGQTVKDGGLCRAVLDKCQDFTYKTTDKKSTYQPYNEIVLNYIQRAMVNIRAAQSRIISEYASSCMADISACYNQQYSQINSWTTSASADSVYSVMTGACYNVALTCGYAVFAYDMNLGQQMNQIKENGVNAGKDEKIIASEQNLTLIQAVSDLFYQSLLCPENSTFDLDDYVGVLEANTTVEKQSVNGAKSLLVQGTSGNFRSVAFVNSRCKCNEGYTAWNNSCVASCSDMQYRNKLGSCEYCDGNSEPLGGVSSHGINVVEHNTCAVNTAADNGD